MKKFVKTVLLIASILAICGGLIVGFVYFFYYGRADKANDKGASHLVYSFPEADIKDVNIDASYGSFRIERGEEWGVTLKNVYAAGASASLKNGCLYISLESAGDINILGWNIGYNMNFNNAKPAVITVTVPYSASLDEFSICTGVGSVTLDGVELNRLVCQTGSGSIDIFDSVVAYAGAIQTGIGNVTGDNVVLKNTSVSIGAGNCDIVLSPEGNESDLVVKIDAGTKNIK